MPQQRIVKNIDGVTHFVPKRSRRSQLIKWFKRSRFARLVIMILVGVIVLAIIFAFDVHKKKPTAATAILNNVSAHMVLPKNEQPLIATVTDKSSLKTPFLKEANNGDKIIIYEKAKRVIIYRPSIDRIIDIGPVELSDIPQTSQ